MPLAASAACAEDAPRDFRMPPQPLAQALDALARQSGLEIAYADDTVRGIRSRGVNGRYSPRGAMAEVLAGTGLHFRFTGDKAVAIMPAPAASVDDATTRPTLAPVTVTATRTEHAVDDVPANVSVITSQDISERNVDKLQDVLRTVDDVEAGQQFSVAHASSIDIRGVGGSYSMPTSKVLVDGIGTDSIVSAVQGHGGLNFLSPWDVEQVEVVRGPASALYGPEVIGCVVNLIPKRWSGAPPRRGGACRLRLAQHGQGRRGGGGCQRFSGSAGVGLRRGERWFRLPARAGDAGRQHLGRPRAARVA